MKNNKYRLEEYIITDYDRLLFTWEIHIALGAQRSGNCFVIGDILVIEPWNYEEAGYLKLEFHEQLRKLPAWNKTRYYCLSSSLRDVSTGQKLSDYFNRQQVREDKSSTGHVRISEPGTFRLGQYKIIVEENSNVSWQTYERLNKTKRGPCVTESGILFIGSEEYDLYESQSKKEWFGRLELLPQWDKTFAWGHLGVLRRCGQGKEPNSFILNSGTKTCITNNMPLLKNHEHKKERGAKILASSFELLKMSWHQFAEWKKLWGRIYPLLIGGLIVGLRIFLFFKEKTANWFRKAKEYFPKPNKK